MTFSPLTDKRTPPPPPAIQALSFVNTWRIIDKFVSLRRHGGERRDGAWRRLPDVGLLEATLRRGYT